MAEHLTFLFAPLDGVGNVNACIGVGQRLLNKGHKVVFAVSNVWKGKLAPLGFIEKFHQDENRESVSIEKWGEMVYTMSPALAMPPLEKMEHFDVPIFGQLVANEKEAYPYLLEIVAEVKPNLILVDMMHNPALCDAGIPWMIFLSINPMAIALENIPPPWSGYPIFSGDTDLWNVYKERAKVVFDPVFQDYKNWVIEKGGPELTFDGRPIWIKDSPYGNMYMLPSEMSYTMHRPDPPNWHQFDTFARIESAPFEIPSKLEKLPGKLVYLSLGTIGCFELELMRKLIRICAKSPHRFIMSKGPSGDKLVLADNMWGANTLPQTNILPMVDLIITHGGNNTMTESFYFGTKILVLPLICDQIDSGRRVEEMGLGLQFDPYRVTEQELLDGIETLLEDELLGKRMKAISTRIQASNSQLRAAELIEDVARKNLPNN